MKTAPKLLLALSLALATLVSCTYDDSALRTDISDLQERVSTLEETVKTANGEISSLWGIVNALNRKETVSSVSETDEGWTVTFSSGKTITVSKKPALNIGVKKGSDGKYYWTIDGDKWLTDSDDKMVPASGIAPQLKIEGGNWYISYDSGESWTLLGPATGGPGEKGDSMFQWVDWDDSFVYFALANGEILRIGRGAGGVQTITAVPGYSDGSVKAYKSVFQIAFDVLPKEAAPKLAAESTDIFELKVVYTTLTKAAAGEALTLPVTGKEGTTDGVLTLTVDGSAIADEFIAGALGASACLNVVFNENAVTSGYFPLKKDPYNNHEFVDLGLPSGLKWATCNVGATKPEEPGDYFAWGEVEPYYEPGYAPSDDPVWKPGKEGGYIWDNYKYLDKEKGILTKYTDEDGLTKLLPEDDAATYNWGTPWRMPTSDEWQELLDQCSCVIDEAKAGLTVTGPNGNSIFLPFTGYFSNFYMVFNDCEGGLYYASDRDISTLSMSANYLYFSESWGIGLNGYDKIDGQSIRAVAE